MSTPGLSLFHGGESIQFNSSFERQQEEEALEDQRRRNEELKTVMQNAFDDLDDDETTIDSTTNFHSDFAESAQQEPAAPSQHNHNEKQLCFTNEVNKGTTGSADHSVCKKEIHNLKMLLESRSHELEHSQQLLNDECKRHSELEKKFKIVEAELDRALSSKKNNHELLVESKEKCSNLKNTIKNMKAEKETLELEKNVLVGKLETVQTLLSEIQRKYDMVQRDLNRNQEHNFELKCKQMEDRHRGNIEMLQEQLKQAAYKLENKSNELDNMNTRYKALQESHQMMLCQKASEINDLSHALDESQKRCNELLTRPDYFQENIKLQKLIASLQEQICGMEKTISSLKERLEATTSETGYFDSLLHQYTKEDTPRRLSQTQGSVVGSTPFSCIDKIGNLKEDLYRALTNLKNKGDEIRKQQQTIDEKQNEIRLLKQEENRSLVQISTLKEENIKLQNKLKVIEEEFDQLKNLQPMQTQSKEDNYVQSLQTELQDMKTQIQQEKKKTHELEEVKRNQETERKMLDSQLKNLEIDLEELKQEHESLKVNYDKVLKENLGLRQRNSTDNLSLELEKHKFLLKDSQAECDRLKNLYVEISNAKEALSYEINNLLKSDKAKELQEQKEKVANLQRSLKLAEVKCSELSKMLETNKLSHEKELKDIREKLEKEKTEPLKSAKDSANECAKCMDYVAELTKFEIQNLKLTNINTISKKEIDELTKELKTSKEHISELNKQLKLSEQQEQLIKELKTKASQFEDYIKTHCSASETSNSSVKSSRQLIDKSVITSPELERNEIKEIKARIRDEMAKILAVELNRFQTKIQESQEQTLCLQRKYQQINIELQQRQTEVELLKQAILAEREKMEEILQQKNDEYKDAIQRHNIAIQKSRDELQTKLQKIHELTNELNERQTQIEAERKSMKAVMKQWEEQRKSIDAVEMDWKQKCSDLQKAHESTIQLWRTKYNSAKRTAANYKRYSEDKEAHMLKEYDRLKIEYDTQLARIQLRMKETFEKKSLELKEALDKQHNLNIENKENTVSN